MKQTKKQTKHILDTLVKRYKTPAFIENDPLSFPHRYKENPRACEMMAFITALMSYGRRESIFKHMNNLLDRIDGDPEAFITGYTPKKGMKAFKNLVYRFYKPRDIDYLFQQLHVVYRDYESLEAFFLLGEGEPVDIQLKGLQAQIHSFVRRFLSEGQGDEEQCVDTYGLKFMFADPIRGGASKRFNMFLRWVLRDDDVDLGLWKSKEEHALSPADLMIPLDTHVASLSRKLGLLKRNTNDWQSAEEITLVLRGYCPSDPIQYDFALFGLGVSGGFEQFMENEAGALISASY